MQKQKNANNGQSNNILRMVLSEHTDAILLIGGYFNGFRHFVIP